MDVFISWSGSVTRKIAGEFTDFLKLVIQRSNPWYSDKTPAGAEWWRTISERLGKSAIGVLFVTQENKDSNWLLFEAGAIAKGVPENRVCVILVDLKNEDIQPPLSLFQTNPLDKDGVFRVLQTINDALPEHKFSEELLRRAMDAHWANFEAKVREIRSEGEQPAPAKPRPDRELIVEILETVRGLDQRMRASEPVDSIPLNRLVLGGSDELTNKVYRLSLPKGLAKFGKKGGEGDNSVVVFTSDPNQSIVDMWERDIGDDKKDSK